MDFNKKIGFICRNEFEWNECQKILFKKGFSWTRERQESFIINRWPLVNSREGALVLIINCSYGSNLKQLEWNHYDNYSYHFPGQSLDKEDLYESHLLFRKLKLEKINKNEI